MAKKLPKIIIFVVLGIASFGGSLFVSMQMHKSAPAKTGEPQTEEELTSEALLLGDMAASTQAELKPNEQQLNDLVKEVRAKLQTLGRRERDLNEREKRLQMAAIELKRQSDQLEERRLKFVAASISLKKAQASIAKTHVLITSQEVVNLQNAAKMYAKMDPANAARIILEMFKNQQGRMATKIIRFMPEKSWAAIMDEIKNSEEAAEIIKQQLTVIKSDEKL